MKKVHIELTPYEAKAVLYAIGQHTIGDKEDCSGNARLYDALCRAEKKVQDAAKEQSVQADVGARMAERDAQKG